MLDIQNIMQRPLNQLLCLLAYLFSFEANAQLGVPNIVINNAATGTECAIIINRQSPTHLLAAVNPGFNLGSANPHVMYKSSDGGLNWTSVPINTYFSTNYASWDPAFASDNQGRFYFQISDSTFKMHNLVSTDYGATWNTESTISNSDKECIRTDNVLTSVYQGNLYSSYTRLNGVGTKSYILLTQSSNHGVSWSQPADTLDSDLGGGMYCPVTGSSVAIGPSGEVNVSWAGGIPNQIHFKKSTDGATTWPSNPTIIDDNVLPETSFLTPIYNITTLEGAWTSLACDVSGGPFNGNLYCAWADFRNSDADIYMGISTDGGSSWNVQRINDDLTNRNQVHPTVAVDPTSGWVYVAFMDGRDDLSGPKDTAHYYLAFSNDGGLNFQNVRIGQNPSTQTLEDDYYGLDVFSGNIHLIWAEATRMDSVKIMTAALTQASLEATSLKETQTLSEIVFYPPHPNPLISLITFDFRLPEKTSVTLTITDMEGNEVASPIKDKIYAQGTHRLEFDKLPLSTGMYIVNIITPHERVSRTLSVVK